MVSVSQPLTQNLEKQQQLLMMKKLLFAVCRGYWERDHITLLSTSTKDLIAELRQFYPTLNEVQQKLNQVVNQLNNREKYLPVTMQLMAKLSQVYGKVTEKNQASFNSLEANQNSINVPFHKSTELRKVVRSLEENQNSERIHKMLFALSKQRWENNLEILSNYPIKQLILEILQAYPNLERVSLNLLKIVKALNKQEIYSQVAQSIITGLARLYQGDQAVEKLKSLVNVSTPTFIQSKVTSNATLTPAKVETETRKHNFDYNPYLVRQRIMKYTNPLRAKILLFYALNFNQINPKEEIDGLRLKSYELDKMLMQLVQKFRTVQELQNHLETTILTINNQMFNSNDNLQVIQAIIMSVKPLYETA